MSAPAQEIGLDQWIEYCYSLRPIENFLLIGLLNRRSFTSIEAVREEQLATDENWRDAKRWALTRLRPGLDLYCREYKKPWAAVGEEFSKTAFESVKVFIPLLATMLNVQLGIAVAFTFWLLRYCLDRWCGKYSARDLAGDGTYTSAQASEYAPVFFELTYRPPIVEWVDDEAAYPLSVPKEQIWIPAEINGLMRVSGKRDVDEILFTFDPNGANRYVFVDRTSAQSVMGRPSNIVRSDKGQHVLGIVGDALEFGQDRPS